jgi:hypothetical protein
MANRPARREVVLSRHVECEGDAAFDPANIAGTKEESAAMPKISNNLSGERGSA